MISPQVTPNSAPDPESRPGWRRPFADLKINTKLTLAFSFLVLIAILAARISYMGSQRATTTITRTRERRVPAALAAAQAQADLLRMQSALRGYLALGEKSYRRSYSEAAQSFDQDLAELEQYAGRPGGVNHENLQQLNQAYQQWMKLPDQLFALRDDQLDREPAYRTLVITGTLYAGQVLIDIQNMIELQSHRDPSQANQILLADMAKYQSTFTSMISALRGYVSTRNRVYRSEYEINRVDCQNIWENLLNSRDQMTEAQQSLLDDISADREAFLTLPGPMLAVLESDHWREDLYLYSNQAQPLADEMQSRLGVLVAEQQTLLTTELSTGQNDLVRTNQLITAGGVLAFLVGLALTYFFQRTIAAPIGRLTSVAEQIRSGDLAAQARVESKDEIGVLAGTFNNMTAKLQQTLQQVRKEKKRADDLLEVVIPIGVDLANEQDLDRLLEKMLLEAQGFCQADTGILYLVSNEDQLQPVLLSSVSQHLLTGKYAGQGEALASLPLAAPAAGELDEPSYAARAASGGEVANLSGPGVLQNLQIKDQEGGEVLAGYRLDSMLVLPLKNSAGQNLGVLQLINAQDPQDGRSIPFDSNLQRMMESFSSLAVAALEAYIREQALHIEIRRLRIEIDQSTRQKQVEEITTTDFFQVIAMKADELRQRRRKNRKPWLRS